MHNPQNLPVTVLDFQAERCSLTMYKSLKEQEDMAQASKLHITTNEPVQAILQHADLQGRYDAIKEDTSSHSYEIMKTLMDDDLGDKDLSDALQPAVQELVTELARKAMDERIPFWRIRSFVHRAAKQTGMADAGLRHLLHSRKASKMFLQWAVAHCSRGQDIEIPR